MAGLNSAALLVAANALRGAMLYGQLHSGPAGTSGTDNVTTAARRSITWASVTGTGDFGISSPLNFTGGAGGAVHSITFWSASTSGTYYGELILAGDATFDGSGNYVVSAIDFDGGDRGTTTTPVSVTYDATGAGATGLSYTGWSWSHTIGSEATALVAMMVSLASSEPTVTMSCGGNPLTLLGAKYNYYFDGSFLCSLSVYGLLNPPTGTQTITVTAPTGSFAGLNSVSYNNVSSFGTSFTNSGTTSIPTITADSAPGQMIVGAFAGYTTAFSTPVSGNLRFNVPWSSAHHLAHMLQDAGAPDRKISTTLTAPAGVGHWGSVAVPLVP